MNIVRGKQLRSRIRTDGELELSLEDTDFGPLEHDDVLVRIDAAPINPSDLGLLLASVKGTSMHASERNGKKVAIGRVSERVMSGMAARLDASLAIGNEGAGVVVAAGRGTDARSLLGSLVAVAGGATFAQFKVAKVSDVLVLPAGASAVDGASSFVNPMTALAMVEVMRLEGHTALAHTAAASNLGQMLNRICLKDGVPLVNIVRSAEQAKILADAGARHVVNSSAPQFSHQLADALAETGATLAFDAIGGGRLATQIFGGMEKALARNASTYSRYGSTTHKQIYIYGGLDQGTTELVRNFGMAWGLSGWLLPPFLARLGEEGTKRLRRRVTEELTTTFKSYYTNEISLDAVLDPEIISAYERKSTGEKYLIRPNLGQG